MNVEEIARQGLISLTLDWGLVRDTGKNSQSFPG